MKFQLETKISRIIRKQKFQESSGNATGCMLNFLDVAECEMFLRFYVYKLIYLMQKLLYMAFTLDVLCLTCLFGLFAT